MQKTLVKKKKLVEVPSYKVVEEKVKVLEEVPATREVRDGRRQDVCQRWEKRDVVSVVGVCDLLS
jgi:hypothetical protein